MITSIVLMAVLGGQFWTEARTFEFSAAVADCEGLDPWTAFPRCVVAGHCAYFGHDYQVEVLMPGPVDPDRWELVGKLIDRRFQGSLLNYDFGISGEDLSSVAECILKEIKRSLPGVSRVKVTVDDSWGEYREE